MNNNDTNYRDYLKKLRELYQDILLYLPMRLQKYAKSKELNQTGLQKDANNAERKIRNLDVLGEPTMSDKEKILKLVSYISEELGAYNNEQYEKSEAFKEYRTRFIDLTNKLISNGITTQLEIDKAETENLESRIEQKRKSIELNTGSLPRNFFSGNEGETPLNTEVTGDTSNEIEKKDLLTKNHIGLAKRLIVVTSSILLAIIPSKLIVDTILSQNRLNSKLSKEVEELTRDGYVHLAESYVAMRASEESNINAENIEVSYQYPENHKSYLTQEQINGLPYYCLHTKSNNANSKGLVLYIRIDDKLIKIGRQDKKQDPHIVVEYQEKKEVNPITGEEIITVVEPDLYDYCEAEHYTDGYWLIVNCIRSEDYKNESTSKKSKKIVKAELKKGLKSGTINYDLLKRFVKNKKTFQQVYIDEQDSSRDIWNESAIKAVTRKDAENSLKWERKRANLDEER